MLRVKDENGNVVPGLFKDDRGAIVVNDKPGYQKYLLEKQHQETINNLKQEVSELKDMIHALIANASNTESKDNKWQQ